MLRRLRRPAALLALLVVPSGLLAACGSETPGSGLDFSDRLDAVTIEGEVGDGVTLDWKDRMTASGSETETLVEGDGEPLADGDTVYVNYLLGNGYTRMSPIDTFGEEEAAVQLTVGGEPVQPNSVNDLVQAFLVEQVEAGLNRGSRLAITGNTQAIFGDYAQSPVLAADGIGNDDGLLIVADVLDVEPLDAPDGAQSPLPDWAPKVDFADGFPTGFDFDGVEKPDATLLSSVLKTGTGEPVAKGDLLVADYIGQVYDAEEPFESSFGDDDAKLARGIGIGQLLPGFDKELVGVPVGSRVLLRIPPKEGYGQQEQENIPKGSTLYFIVDILASV